MRQPPTVFSITEPNIGDDFQAIAYDDILGVRCKRHDRDFMAETDPESKLILHGWIMKPKVPLGASDPPRDIWENKLGCAGSPKYGFSFPPRARRVLCISMHATEPFRKWLEESPGARSWFSGREVGCRDKVTLEYMESIGAKSWLSGCATLCIKPRPKKRLGPPMAVDLYVPEERLPGWGRRGLRKRRLPWGLERWMARTLPGGCPRWLARPTQYVDMGTPEARRQEIAQQVLQQYADAEVVFTRRLHVALPCVALGTPVVLVAWKGITATERSRLQAASQYIRLVEEEELPELPEPPPIDVVAVEATRKAIREKVEEFSGQP